MDGGWRDDQDFGKCVLGSSPLCGIGNKTKSKYCDNPAPFNGGELCSCNANDQKEIFCDGITATTKEDCNVTCPNPKGKYFIVISVRNSEAYIFRKIYIVSN